MSVCIWVVLQAMAHIWKSKNNTVESVVSFYLNMFSRYWNQIAILSESKPPGNLFSAISYISPSWPFFPTHFIIWSHLPSSLSSHSLAHTLPTSPSCSQKVLDWVLVTPAITPASVVQWMTLHASHPSERWLQHMLPSALRWTGPNSPTLLLHCSVSYGWLDLSIKPLRYQLPSTLALDFLTPNPPVIMDYLSSRRWMDFSF